MNDHPILKLDNLSVEYGAQSGFFGLNKRVVRAVKKVSLTVRPGETLGLVGESGCGKTSTGQAAYKLIPAAGGRIEFMGTDITNFTRAQMRPLRRQMQVVYQDPFGSLNPRMRAGDIVTEPMQVLRIGDRVERRDRAAELLETVGLGGHMTDRYPHEFSGGQRQRLAIARAFSVRPSLVLCDEPVSALDVSIQAQILNLFMDLKERFGLSYLFVSHDLAVVRHVSDRIAVMYFGRIVETARRDDLYEEPLHPYTQTLLDAVPVADPVQERPQAYVPPKGEVPSLMRPPGGCPFHPRCPAAMDRCRSEFPHLKQVAEGREVACHLYEETDHGLDPAEPADTRNSK